MSNKFDLNAVQSAINYDFRDPALIKTAFTHFSAVQNGERCNTSFVFLGQRLLDLILTDRVCRDEDITDEKELSEKLDYCKSSLGYESYLSEHSLTDCIILSELSESLRNSSLIHGQIFLAMLAAIYRDDGMPSLKSFLLPMIRLSDGGTKYSPKPLSSFDRGDFDGAKQRPSAEKSKKTLKISMVSEAVKFFTKSKKTEKPEKSVKSEKSVKKEQIQKKAAKKESETVENVTVTETAPSETKDKKTFIRDALKPVTLPESTKTKSQRSEKKPSQTPKKAKTEESAKTENITAADNNNYKSMLQELIQKNMHSSSVLLKYVTSSPSKGKSITTVTLDGNELASGEGSTKKESEREAAKKAYTALINKRSKLFKWFSSLGGEEHSETEQVREDYVSRLNRHYQKLSHTSSAPLTYEKRPSEKKSVFNVAIIANGEEISFGTGKTLKEAKQSAAEAACAKLGI